MGCRIGETQMCHKKNIARSRDPSHCTAIPPLPSIQETHRRLSIPSLPTPPPPRSETRLRPWTHQAARAESQRFMTAQANLILLAGLWCWSEKRGERSVPFILSSLDITPRLSSPPRRLGGTGSQRYRLSSAANRQTVDLARDVRLGNEE